MDRFEINIQGEIRPGEDFFKEVFRPGTDAYGLLKSAIEREFRANGAPEVKRMAADRVQYDPGSGKGSFRVVLDIDYTFGCEDLLTQKENETSEWTFQVNGDTISFYSSPFAESRSTADEF